MKRMNGVFFFFNLCAGWVQVDRVILNLRILIARKSALEKTQLSDVLITDNLF